MLQVLRSPRFLKLGLSLPGIRKSGCRHVVDSCPFLPNYRTSRLGGYCRLSLYSHFCILACAANDKLHSKKREQLQYLTCIDTGD